MSADTQQKICCDDDGCIAVLVGGIDDLEKSKVETTIEIPGLNRIDRLNQKRGKTWDGCLLVTEDYRGAQAQGAQELVWVLKKSSIAHLKRENEIRY